MEQQWKKKQDFFFDNKEVQILNKELYPDITLKFDWQLF